MEDANLHPRVSIRSATPGLDSALHVLISVGDRRLDQAGAFPRGRGDRDACVPPGEAGALPRADERPASPRRHGCHAQSPSGYTSSQIAPRRTLTYL